MKRKILIEPDPILRKKCESLEKVDTDVQNLMQDMLETMYEAPGIGLAAVQIGILKRVIVIDLSKKGFNKFSTKLLFLPFSTTNISSVEALSISILIDQYGDLE